VTAFERRLRDLIALEGPITVERFMALCLQHYYATRDPLGAAGDFTTAPEISQMFGELIGLWAVEIWHAMGQPGSFRLVELGPGRGTLMADALRAARLAPGFLTGANIHLVETSPALRERQKDTLAAAPVRVAWHERFESVPPGPAIVIANEFFDALPVRQFVAAERGWCERLVGLSEDRLAFGLRAEPESGLGAPRNRGDVLEWPQAAMAFVQLLARRLVDDGGGALVVDYGHWGPAFGDTLQAVRHHGFAAPLTDPGEADLTVHVDFHRLAEAASGAGAAVHGPAAQGEFLQALGIEARAAGLKRRATPAQADDVDRALKRLTGRGSTAMGEVFKVLALTHPTLTAVPGLPARPPTLASP
jgi:NADH dehydrogenase [ubiquinone] 1 alpha subcomplex assembly factor 7